MPHCHRQGNPHGSILPDADNRPWQHYIQIQSTSPQTDRQGRRVWRIFHCQLAGRRIVPFLSTSKAHPPHRADEKPYWGDVRLFQIRYRWGWVRCVVKKVHASPMNPLWETMVSKSYAAQSNSSPSTLHVWSATVNPNPHPTIPQATLTRAQKNLELMLAWQGVPGDTHDGATRNCRIDGLEAVKSREPRFLLTPPTQTITERKNFPVTITFKGYKSY